MKVIKNKALGNIARKIGGVFRAGNNSSVPSIEEIFKCIAFRIAGGNLTPRISHVTGGDPLNLEGYVPRLSCLKGLLGKGGTSTAAVRRVKAKPVEQTHMGVKIPARPPEVRAVPAASASVPVKEAPVRVVRTSQPETQQPRYIIKP